MVTSYNRYMRPPRRRRPRTRRISLKGYYNWTLLSADKGETPLPWSHVKTREEAEQSLAHYRKWQRISGKYWIAPYREDGKYSSSSNRSRRKRAVQKLWSARGKKLRRVVDETGAEGV
jgi:hypothetical protein